jgi:hypothetical protein
MGRDRGESTVHAVEDAVFDPAHSDFAEIEVPPFRLLFFQCADIETPVASRITSVSTQHKEGTAEKGNCLGTPDRRCYSRGCPLDSLSH